MINVTRDLHKKNAQLPAVYVSNPKYHIIFHRLQPYLAHTNDEFQVMGVIAQRKPQLKLQLPLTQMVSITKLFTGHSTIKKSLKFALLVISHKY